MTVRLNALVKSQHGQVRHAVVRKELSGKLATHDLPVATTLVIEFGESGVLLLRYGSAGEFCGDTWHLTADEAKCQAKFEFDVEPNEWQSDC